MIGRNDDARLKTHYLMGWLVFFASVLAFYIKLSQNPDFWFLPLYQADVFQLPALYKNIVMDGGSWFDWVGGSSLYLFPDTILYFLLNAFTNNAYGALVAYSIIQVIALAMASLFLASSLFGKTPYVVKTGILLGCTFLMLVLAKNVDVDEYNILYPILLPVFHGSGLVILIFMLGVTVRAFKNVSQAKVVGYSVLLFVISTLTILSDFLYIVQFIVPMLICVGLLTMSNRLSRRSGLLLLGALMGACVLGVAINVMLFHASSGPNQFYVLMEENWHINRYLINIYRLASDFVITDPFYSAILVSYFLAGCWVIKAYCQSKPQDEKILFLFVFYFAVFLVNVAAVSLLGNFMRPGSSRYMLPLLVLPVCIGWPVLLYHVLLVKKIEVKPIAVAFVVVCMLLMPLSEMKNIKSLRHLKSPYPALVACLDQHAIKYDLHNGIAGFFEARPYYFLSRENLFVGHVLGDFLPGGLFSFPNYENREFDFAIISGEVSEKRLQERFGEPDAAFFCDDVKVVIYQNDLFKHQFQDREIFQETRYGRFYRS